MTGEHILDVRSEPPVRRHALIFETFDALAPGAGFGLANDHDPKPLSPLVRPLALEREAPPSEPAVQGGRGDNGAARVDPGAAAARGRTA